MVESLPRVGKSRNIQNDTYHIYDLQLRSTKVYECVNARWDRTCNLTSFTCPSSALGRVKLLTHTPTLVLNQTQSARAPKLTSRAEVTRHENDDGVALGELEWRGVEKHAIRGSDG